MRHTARIAATFAISAVACAPSRPATPAWAGAPELTDTPSRAATAQEPASTTAAAPRADGQPPQPGTAHRDVVEFAAGLDAAAPPELAEFVTRFFSSLTTNWRTATRFLDQETVEEIVSNIEAEKQGKLPRTEEFDADLLASAIGLHRFHGDSQPPDKDGAAARLALIERVKIERVEARQVETEKGVVTLYDVFGTTSLADHRVYRANLTIRRDPAGMTLLPPL